MRNRIAQKKHRRSGSAMLLLLMSLPAGLLADTDLHTLWDDRCLECHGHAGQYAREHLYVENGVVTGNNAQRDLREFLSSHRGAAENSDAVYDMLLAQATSEARFRSDCGGCHSDAADLLRSRLIRKEGELTTRSSGQPLVRFLPGHGGLPLDDVPFFFELLKRIDGEVN